MSSSNSNIVLGIDPGTSRCGWGVVGRDTGKLKCLGYGIFEVKKNDKTGAKLYELQLGILDIIRKFNPSTVLIEDLFFAKNRKTAISVAQARGVILATCASQNLDIIEQTPRQIKQAITGYGAAGKAQMQKMVQLHLGLDEIPKPDDAADALAAAIVGAQISKSLLHLK